MAARLQRLRDSSFLPNLAFFCSEIHLELQQTTLYIDLLHVWPDLDRVDYGGIISSGSQIRRAWQLCAPSQFQANPESS